MADLAVRVRLVEGSTSLATARSHGVVIDRPTDKGGGDLGFLGGELLLASEGGCPLSNLVAAAQARGIRLHQVDVTVRGIPADHPPRFAEVLVEVAMEADASPEDLDTLLTVAERGCIVSNTLRGGTMLTVRRRDDAAVPAS
ncbi:MAG: OsmC family protein [Chloroflexota bacterium]|nr:OsmC family protein [Chloroflexota bacterium]